MSDRKHDPEHPPQATDGEDRAERLQKVLARAGVGSRRQVEELIRQGRVVVNGNVAELGQKADLSTDAVKVDGKRIQPPKGQSLYLLLNKPVSVVSTRHDPEGRPTVLDLVPARLHRGLVTVGRLDFDSEGLLLLTNDGDFANRVAHPKFGCIKTYEVKVRGLPSDVSIEKLRSGVVIDGRRTAPARITPHGHIEGHREASANSWWRVGLGEGRTRQIREMFQRVGHPVQRLRRVAIGPLSDPRLAKGAWRILTPDEVTALLDASGEKGRKAFAPRPRATARAARAVGGRGAGGGRPAKGGPAQGRAGKNRSGDDGAGPRKKRKSPPRSGTGRRGRGPKGRSR